MEIIKRQIGDFNHDLDAYSDNINVISDAISVQLFGKLKDIFSRIQILQIKKIHVDSLAQVLLVNIKRHMDRIHISQEVFAQSKSLKSLLTAVEQEIVICIQSICYDEQSIPSRLDISSIPEETVKPKIVDPEIVVPKPVDVNETIELGDDILTEYFDELEEYLQLEIDVNTLTADTWEDVYEEYKNYIASIGKKQSQKIRNIIQAQMIKATGRYKVFIIKIAEIMEQNIQKSDEYAQKEEDLKKLHELRREKVKRGRESDLLALMLDKNTQYSSDVSQLIDSYSIDEKFPFKHDIYKHLEEWETFSFDLQDQVEKRETYFVSNMFHKYTARGLDILFKNIKNKAHDTKLDPSDIQFQKKSEDRKVSLQAYIKALDIELKKLSVSKSEELVKINNDLSSLTIKNTDQ